MLLGLLNRFQSTTAHGKTRRLHSDDTVPDQCSVIHRLGKTYLLSFEPDLIGGVDIPCNEGDVQTYFSLVNVLYSQDLR
jgi:hypothetical protein